MLNEKPNFSSHSHDNKNKETGYFKLSDYKKQLKLFSGYNNKKETQTDKLHSKNTNAVDLCININNNKNNNLNRENFFVNNNFLYL